MSDWPEGCGCEQGRKKADHSAAVPQTWERGALYWRPKSLSAVPVYTCLTAFERRKRFHVFFYSVREIGHLEAGELTNVNMGVTGDGQTAAN